MTLPPAIWSVPDSAIVLPGRPIFLPDFSEAWSVELSPALRISRLGKAISEKFANRYYDAITLVLRLKPDDMINAFQEANEPQCLASAFDNCVQLGEWIPIGDEGLPETINIKVFGTDLSLTKEQLRADASIADISRYITIRTGDIICPASMPIAFPVKVGATFTASLMDKECLSARIK